jgi:hypothetical protein
MEGMSKRYPHNCFKAPDATALDQSLHALPASQIEFLRSVVPRNSPSTGAERPPLRRDVNPGLIGQSLAESAGSAEIPGATSLDLDQGELIDDRNRSARRARRIRARERKIHNGAMIAA